MNSSTQGTKPRGGRIAMVLKEARASLKEPSRPHTPASLDARTAMSLDGAMSRAEKYDAKRDNPRGGVPAGGKSNKKQQLDIWVNENVDNSDDSNGDGYGQSSVANKAKLSINSTEFMYGLLAEDLRSSVGDRSSRQNSRRNSEDMDQSVFNMNPSISNSVEVEDRDSAQGQGGGSHSNLQLMICDLKDALSSLDNALGSSIMDAAIFQTLEGMTGPVDKLSKHIKSGGSKNPNPNHGMQKDLDGVLIHFKRTLMRVVTERKSNGTGKMIIISQGNTSGDSLCETTRLACRHLLRVYVSILARSATSSLSADVARVVMRASKALYQIDTTTAVSNSSRGGGSGSAKQQQQESGDPEGSESGNGSESTRGSQSRSSGRRGSRSGSGSGSGSSNAMDAAMLQGCPDLLLEMLTQTWTRLPSDLYRELHPSEEGRGCSGGGKAAAADAVDEYGLPAYLSNPLFLLLEAAVFTSGILRCYSTSNVNARRLMHLGLVECMVNGMRVAVSSGDVIEKVYRKREAKMGSSDALDTDFSLIRQIAAQISRCMEQVTATLRAFALDGQGRTKLLDQGAITLLCKLTARRDSFQATPGLVLNCVRNASKLSLLEPFRTQLNSKRSSIEHLCALLSAEAESAASVASATGGMGAVFSTGESWPQWHTWPLLSRVCFTLGNLTTSNDANRTMIAITCESLRPLAFLLRECGQNLQKLARERRMRDMGALLGGDEDLEESEELVAESDECGENMSPQRASIDEPVLEDEEGDNIVELMGDAGEGGKVDDEETCSPGYSQEETEARAKEQEIADAAIKILRLVANVAIESRVGSLLASDSQALLVVVQLLGDHCHESTISSSSGSPFSEELLLNIVAACTNISYYACIKASTFSHIDVSSHSAPLQSLGEGDKDADLSMSFEESAELDLESLRKESESEEEAKQKLILKTLMKMTSHLSSALFHPNDEIVLEAARALGNLTRLPQVLSSLSSSRTDEALVLLLGHHHMEVVAAVAGTLVNLSAHPPSKCSLLLHTAAPALLVKALRRSSLRHMTTSMLISQVFHNLLARPTYSSKSGEEKKNSSEVDEDALGVPSTEFPGLMETLDELVDLALEMTEREDDKYAGFAKVGGAVRELLIQKDKDQGREWAKSERGAPAYYVEEEDEDED